MTTIPSSRVLRALLTGLTTTAYYAVPDVARTRASRGWLKAACVAAALAVSAPDVREGWHDMRRSWRDAVDGTTGDGEVDGTDPDGVSLDGATPDATPSPTGPAIAVGLVVVVASIAGTVAAERWLFRRGQAAAAAGVRCAHTRTALALGALTAAADLVLTATTPSGDRSPDDPSQDVASR
ncbi:hypothetical protein [Cellulomonas phragmiteti]|uniref:Peptidase S9 n=1 Tax=Cellulomonas phragmiteti TaxID=478780 RepID=A0ABQ4DPB0_9CELL|nr:hypothetical protein [Cellulomonas phragmiteti]GIG41186.1 hypothetical protein Cph01nite_29480 [Cellulomonas phragmiteti]